MKRRMKIRIWIWVCNNLAQCIRSSLPPLGGFLLDDEEEINTPIRRPPIGPAMNSAQEEAQEAQDYLLELTRRRRERWNDAPEGGDCTQQPSLLFMIPVLVSFFLLLQF